MSRTPSQIVHPIDPRLARVYRLQVRFAVGWFLNDPVVWARLREIYVATAYSPDGTSTTLHPLPIPALPPGCGERWYVIFRSVYKTYRGMLRKVRPVREEDDRWVSYGLSFEALTKCATLGKHCHYGYVHKACLRAHMRHLQEVEVCKEKTRGDGFWDGQAGQEAAEDTDSRLDLEDALGRLDSTDAEICRYYLLEEYTFAEIGRMMGLHESSVQRRYTGAIEYVKKALRDYDRPLVWESGGKCLAA